MIVNPYGKEYQASQEGQQYAQQPAGNEPPCPAGQHKNDRNQCIPDAPVNTSDVGRTYQQVAGWDTNKLNDPTRSGPRQGGSSYAKYDFMRTVQNMGTGASPENLAAITNDARLRQLYPNMQVIGRDKIDFGDGNGPIDVLVGSGAAAAGGPAATWGWGAGGGAGQSGAIQSFLSGTSGGTPMTPRPGQANWTPGTFTPSAPPPSYSGWNYSPVQPFAGSPMPTYQAQEEQFGTYSRPGTSAATEGVLGRILSNPAADASIQQKAAQKESILTMADQLRQQALQDAARRGVGGGGNLSARLGDLGSATLGDISRAYRDIDINQAAKARRDELDALSAGMAFDRSRLDEFLGTSDLDLRQRGYNRDDRRFAFGSEADANREAYNRYLSGESLGFERERAQADEGRFGYQAQVQAARDEFDRWAAQQGLGRDAANMAFQQWAAENGLNLDWARFGEGQRQFNRNIEMDLAQFLGA